jgi:PGF-pre-PGF domain-containing protein
VTGVQTCALPIFQNISISVTKLEGAPATVTKSLAGKVYKYMEINKTNVNDTDVSSVKIRFTVNKSWMAENNFTEAYLNRWETSDWRELPTTKVSENSTDVTYEAESPGLSVFAITGEAAAPAPAAQDCRTLGCQSGYECKIVGTAYQCAAKEAPAPTGGENVTVPVTPPVSPPVSPPTQPPAVTAPQDYTLVVAAVVLVVLAAAGYVLLRKQGKKAETARPEQPKQKKK